MTCFRTFYVYKGTDEATREPVQVPCGWCIGCRLDKSKQWGVRCMHEAQKYDDNCFITLTYDNEHLPDDGSIYKSHMQEFMKNLRNNYPKKRIRFYGCGEYGYDFDRPHYHICLFNHDFDDKTIVEERRKEKPFQKGQFTAPYYVFTSKELRSIWGKGRIETSNLTLDSACYVARYVTKKITGKKAEEHYKGRTPEFALMSRRPGIGKPWLDSYWKDVYPKDYFTFNGVKIKPPRYYDDILKKINPEKYDLVKDKREFFPRKEISSLRKRQMERYKEIIINNTLKRRYEI